MLGHVIGFKVTHSGWTSYREIFVMGFTSSRRRRKRGLHRGCAWLHVGWQASVGREPNSSWPEQTDGNLAWWAETRMAQYGDRQGSWPSLEWRWPSGNPYERGQRGGGRRGISGFGARVETWINGPVRRRGSGIARVLHYKNTPL